MNNMPGAFPVKAFSSTEFNFTPSKPLYPSITPMSLHQECNNLGYSKKLSNNVLDELDKRAATKVKHLNKSILSPRSSRYNSSHRAKFQKMESISNHYATIRSKTSCSSLRQEVEMEKENVGYDPNSKRAGVSILGSASKRRRTATGRQEVVAHTPVAPTHHASSRVRDKNPTCIKKAIPHSRTLSQNISQLTHAKQLPRSSTLQNLTKPTASSLQRSVSNKNLGQTLRSQPSLASISSVSHSLPRVKSSMNLKPGSKPAWR